MAVGSRTPKGPTAHLRDPSSRLATAGVAAGRAAGPAKTLAPFHLFELLPIATLTRAGPTSTRPTSRAGPRPEGQGPTRSELEAWRPACRLGVANWTSPSTGKEPPASDSKEGARGPSSDQPVQGASAAGWYLLSEHQAGKPCHATALARPSTCFAAVARSAMVCASGNATDPVRTSPSSSPSKPTTRGSTSELWLVGLRPCRTTRLMRRCAE